MGGKKKDAQRTKGNLRPSSSGRAAELLAAKGQGADGNSFGFMGFNTATSVPGCHAAEVPPPAESCNVGVCNDADFRIVLKKMSKRDAVTKLKALQEFTAYSKEKGEDVLVDVLQFFPRLYSKLSMECDRRIREATQLAMGQLATRVLAHLVSPACLKSMLGTWLLAQCDPYAPAASAARAAFSLAFPSPEQRRDAVMSSLDDAVTAVVDLLLNSSPATLGDAKTVSPEEMAEKHERMLACSLHALHRLLQIVANQEDRGRRKGPSVLPAEVTQPLLTSYRTAVSDAKLWKLAKHESTSVRAAFYALISSLCHYLPGLVEEKAEKICPLVLGCLNVADPGVCPFVWEAALSVLTNVKEWWKHVSVRKAMLPALWSGLRRAGSGCAGVTHPSCLPLLSLVCSASASNAVGDVHGFLAEFMGNMREGLYCEGVQKSPAECAQVVQSYVECIRYAVQRELELGSSVTSIAQSFVSGHLLSVTEMSLTQPSSTLAKSPFYALLCDLDGNWRRRSMAVKESQMEFSESYSELVQYFWGHLTDTCKLVCRSACERCDDGQVFDRLMALLRSLSAAGRQAVTITAGSGLRGKRVAFKELADETACFSALAVDSDAELNGSTIVEDRCFLSAGQTSSPVAEVIELSAAVSAVLLDALGKPVVAEYATESSNQSCVHFLTQIVECFGCPRYFATVLNHCSGANGKADNASACHDLAMLLVNRAQCTASAAAAASYLRLVIFIGQHLDSDCLRLDVLQTMSATIRSMSLPLNLVELALGRSRWHAALRMWSTAADFCEAFRELTNAAVRSLDAGDGPSIQRSLTLLSQATNCLSTDCAILLEGTIRVAHAIHSCLTKRPVPAPIAMSLEYLETLLTSHQVPSHLKASLGIDLYRLLLDQHSDKEVDVPQLVCSRLLGLLRASIEFKDALSAAVMSDLTCAASIDRLMEISHLLSYLEPSLSTSFVDTLMTDRLQNLEATDEHTLVQWLSVPALSCDFILDSYEVFCPRPLPAASSPPASLPLIGLGFLMMSAGVEKAPDSKLATDVVDQVGIDEERCAITTGSAETGILSLSRSYSSDGHFLRTSLWVLGCCQAALSPSSDILSEDCRAYCSKIANVITDGLKRLDWQRLGDVSGMLQRSSSTSSASSVSTLMAAVAANELCLLGFSHVLWSPLRFLPDRIHKLIKEEYQYALVVLRNAAGSSDIITKSKILGSLVHIANNKESIEDPAYSTRVLFAMANILSSDNQIPFHEFCQDVFCSLMEVKKSDPSLCLAKCRLCNCSATAIKWNVAAMRVLGLAVQKASSRLDSKQWDFLLCSLVEWTGCIAGDKRRTFLDMVFIANVASLVNVVATCMKEQVASKPADYPQGLLTEWVEFYCQELYLNILPFVLLGMSVDSLPYYGHHFVLSCLYEAAAHCPLHCLITYELPQANGQAAVVTAAAASASADLSAPPGLSYVLGRLFIQLCSTTASLQAASYMLLLKLMPELPKHHVAPSSEDHGTTERPLPAVIERALACCMDEGLHNTSRDDTDCGGALDAGSSADLRDHASTELLSRLRGYVLAWKVLLKYWQYCPAEVQAEHTEYIKRREYVDALLRMLVDIIPMEKLANSKPGMPSFSKKGNVNFNGTITQEELISLGCSVYYSLLKLLPVLVRRWWADADKRTAQAVDRFTTRCMSHDLCTEEVETIQAGRKQFDNLVVKVRPAAREVVALYSVEEFSMELVIKLPANHPLGVAEVECSKRLGVAPAEWRTWMLQLTTFLTQQNGSITNAICSWKRNLDKKFEGAEECYICYSVLHGSNLQLPKQQCRTCHHRFHSDCLYKWFSSSQKSSCPLCRNLF